MHIICMTTARTLACMRICNMLTRKGQNLFSSLWLYSYGFTRSTVVRTGTHIRKMRLGGCIRHVKKYEQQFSLKTRREGRLGIKKAAAIYILLYRYEVPNVYCIELYRAVLYIVWFNLASIRTTLCSCMDQAELVKFNGSCTVHNCT